MRVLPPRQPAPLPKAPAPRGLGLTPITSNSSSRRSLWQGPQIDGITYSLLSKFLCCPERFRLKVVEGLQEPWGWKYQVEYGSLFHAAEEAHAGGQPWEPALKAYYEKLLEKYPANEKDIGKWYLLCKMQFPLYVAHWKQHEIGQTPLYEEKPFRFNYCHTLDVGAAFGPHLSPEKFCVLRGKLDSAFERKGFIYIKENKTKGEIDQEGLSTTVDQNLQTMIYHIALRNLLPPQDHKRIAGTVYNVIRRPLSDRYPVRQGKKETLKDFIDRIAKKIASEPSKHFFRWTVPISDRHLHRFQVETLNPILRWLCMWWDSIKADPFSPDKSPWHFRYPFGVYHSVGLGYRGDYFEYLTTGSKRGLERITDLFPEVH